MVLIECYTQFHDLTRTSINIRASTALHDEPTQDYKQPQTKSELHMEATSGDCIKKYRQIYIVSFSP